MSVSTPQLVGRDAELEVIDDTLEAVQAGPSRTLGLLGEPGIGKSRLPGELARRAVARGHLVLAGRAAELERDVPFALWVDALDGRVAELPSAALAALGAERLADLAVALPAITRVCDVAPSPTVERHRVARAVRGLVEELVGRQPVAVVLGALVVSALIASAAFAGSVHAAVAGLELVSGNVNNPLTGLDLHCPPGKEVIGVGGFVGDADSGQVKLITLWPSSFFGARVDATTDQDGFTGFWSVSATATCADPLAGREVRRLLVAHPASDPDSDAFGRVGCSAGKKVVGMAARLTGVRGQVALTTLDTIDEGNSQVIAQAVEDKDGFAGDWRLEMLAVCANPLPGYEVVHRRSAITSAGKSFDAPCPAGKRTLAGGARTEVDGITRPATARSCSTTSPCRRA